MMLPQDDERSDEQLRAELSAALDPIQPPAPRWEALPWHVRPPWPHRILWARRAALATGLVIGANAAGRAWFADRPPDGAGDVVDVPEAPAPVAPPLEPPLAPPPPPAPRREQPPAPPAPQQPEPRPPEPEQDALVFGDPAPDAPPQYTRGGQKTATAIAFAVRALRDGQCERLDSTLLPPGQALCFQLSVRPAAAVVVVVEAPEGTSELARLESGPARVVVSLPSGAPLSYTPSRAGRYRFYAVEPGEVCGPGCHSVTLEVGP